MRRNTVPRRFATVRLCNCNGASSIIACRRSIRYSAVRNSAFFFLQTHLLDCLSYIQHGGETVRIYHDLQVLNLCMHIVFGRKRQTYVRTDLIPWTALRAALRSLPFRVVHSRLHEVMEERTRWGIAGRKRESKHIQLLSSVFVGNNLWFDFLWYVIHSKLTLCLLELTLINPQSSH